MESITTNSTSFFNNNANIYFYENKNHCNDNSIYINTQNVSISQQPTFLSENLVVCQAKPELPLNKTTFIWLYPLILSNRTLFLIFKQSLKCSYLDLFINPYFPNDMILIFFIDCYLWTINLQKSTTTEALRSLLR